MFALQSLLGARMSTLTSAGSVGSLIDPAGLIVASDTASTSWGAGLTSDTSGLKGTAQNFRVVVPGPATSVAFTVRCRVPWTLTTQSAGAGTRGTIVASVFVDGVLIPGATANGAPRNLNSANGTQFVELLEMAVTTPVAINAGSEIVLQLQPEVTIASGVPGSTCELTLRHDPQSIASQLVCEFQGLS